MYTKTASNMSVIFNYVPKNIAVEVFFGHIDDKTMEYLTAEDPKPGRFYLLPKIYKENNPGRPIVSANGHPTEKISEFIDFHLRPFVENLPSHIISDAFSYSENV